MATCVEGKAFLHRRRRRRRRRRRWQRRRRRRWWLNQRQTTLAGRIAERAEESGVRVGRIEGQRGRKGRLCVYIPEYLAKARSWGRETSARGSVSCSCRVHSVPMPMSEYVLVIVFVRAHVHAHTRASDRPDTHHRQGVARVCAQPPRTRRCTPSGGRRGALVSQQGLGTPIRGGTTPHQRVRSFPLRLRSYDGSSLLIIRRYTTYSATMALRGSPESSFYGTRAASAYQRHC